ncbi:hypothetical protein N7475_009948 [Penicillium sp. IBT 31633x]|nr:hypothetical protein N7475_009948 [Penicillium sp. IBT 31633x]
MSELIGPLALGPMSVSSQAGVRDPLSHLVRKCQEGDHILAPWGNKQKYYWGCTFAGWIQFEDVPAGLVSRLYLKR